jgi:uncharacterized glyoxalase superfamily protein PhnB
MAAASPFTPCVFYRDPSAALSWLEVAFGFETSLLVSDQAGAVAHAEMSFGGGSVTIGGEWGSPELLGPATMKSPASLAGQGTQFIRVTLEEGLDAHCIRAEAAGARIVQRPEDQFYGSRTYRALDLEGHVWVFDQPIEEVPVVEMEAATGLTIQTALAR